MRDGASGMSTKELQRKLRELGRSSQGPRSVLAKQYERYALQEGKGDASTELELGPHVSEHPMMVMVDESTRNK